MYMDNLNAELSNSKTDNYDQLDLEGKMARVQEEEDEIATGLLNVMLHRFHQLGRESFTVSDYRALRLTLQAMLYLGQGQVYSSKALAATARTRSNSAGKQVTAEEQQQLIAAALAEGEGI
jgi:Ca2+-dependent lipid-binding protein